jgi:hypothetical protein
LSKKSEVRFDRGLNIVFDLKIYKKIEFTFNSQNFRMRDLKIFQQKSNLSEESKIWAKKMLFVLKNQLVRFDFIFKRIKTDPLNYNSENGCECSWKSSKFNYRIFFNLLRSNKAKFLFIKIPIGFLNQVK